MKRLLIFLLLAALMLAGCDGSIGDAKEPVTFYYLLEEYAYGQDAQVFAPELWESSGHRQDLPYLLSLYLMGPSEEGHVSALPPDTRVLTVKQFDNGVSLELSDTAGTLTDAAFTRACACLALTCFDITDTQAVTIRSGSRSVTMGPNTLILADDSPITTEEPA